MGSTRSLDELAHELGRLRWLQLRLFEELGRWATGDHTDDGHDPDPSAIRRFGEWSNRLAWHAELVAGRIPDLAGIGTTECTAPDDAATRTLATAVEAAAPQRATVLQQHLLPDLADRVDRLRQHTDSRTDGPTARLVELLARDLDPASASR